MVAVINRADLGFGAEEFCEAHGLRILVKIPFDRKVARAYAERRLVAEEMPKYRRIFEGIWEGILREVR